MRAVGQLRVCLNTLMQQRRAYATTWTLDVPSHSATLLLDSRLCKVQAMQKFELAVELLYLTETTGADSKTMVNLHQVMSFQLLQPRTNTHPGAQTCC